MTGKERTLGETYEISEDIIVAQSANAESQIADHQLQTPQSKEVKLNSETTTKREIEIYSQPIKENENSSEEKKSSEKEREKQQIEVNSNIKSLLANTLSIQQQMSSQEASQSASLIKNSMASKNSKVSLISSTGIVQQTDRPDLKMSQRLEESSENKKNGVH